MRRFDAWGVICGVLQTWAAQDGAHAERGSRHALQSVPDARLNDDHAVDRLARRDGSRLV